MQIDHLTRLYQSKTDGELTRLAEDAHQLTPDATIALKNELARRRMDLADLEIASKVDSAKPESIRETFSSQTPFTIPTFLKGVLQTYHQNFLLSLALTSPAPVLGFIWIYIFQRTEIVRRVFDNPNTSFRTGALILISLQTVGYFLGATLSYFSFAAICVAVRERSQGKTPALVQSFAMAWQRPWALLRISLLLSGVFMVLNLIGIALITGLYRLPIKPVGMEYLSLILSFLALMIMAKLSLSVPAIILDEYPVWQSLFLSDELTDGKSLALGILLVKSMIVVRVGIMFPTWIYATLPPTVTWPIWFYWTVRVISLLIVMIAEPPVFIGFVRLYLQTSVAKPVKELAPATV